VSIDAIQFVVETTNGEQVFKVRIFFHPSLALAAVITVHLFPP